MLASLSVDMGDPWSWGNVAQGWGTAAPPSQGWQWTAFDAQISRPTPPRRWRAAAREPGWGRNGFRPRESHPSARSRPDSRRASTIERMGSRRGLGWTLGLIGGGLSWRMLAARRPRFVQPRPRLSKFRRISGIGRSWPDRQGIAGSGRRNAIARRG